MSHLEVLVLMVVVVVVARLGWAVWHWRATPAQQAALAQTTLAHFTSTAAAAIIDQGNGTVHPTSRHGWTARITELSHGNSAGFFSRSEGAVYLYAVTPPAHVRQFHGHANDVMIEIHGSDLTLGQLHCSPHDSAVAIRNGQTDSETLNSEPGITINNCR